MRIRWTRHGEERQQAWEEKLAISRHEVERVLRNPEQVVPGDRGVLVAQSKRGEGILRVLYVESEEAYKILTVYWTTKVEKYWKEEGGAN